MVLTGFRKNGINTEESAGELFEPCIGNLFLLHPLHREALLHHFVHIRNSDDDEALIVFHAGNLGARCSHPSSVHGPHQARRREQ